MNKKQKALASSVISLLLCVSMLLGSTFAWFTDTVTSTANVISTGSLKVELWHTSAAYTTPTQVTNETKDLFKVDLWEPGVAAYENFTVKSVGSLWLKYQLGLNALDQNYVQRGANRFGLSEALVAGVVPGGIQDSNNDGTITREEAVGQITEWKKLSAVLENGTLAPRGETGAVTGTPVTDTTAYGVVIWWQPGTNDNNWNVNNGANTSDGNPLTVDLGVTLSATQYTKEEDSFGDDYDTGAEFPELNLPVKITVAVPSENGLTTQDVTMQGRDVKATVPAGVQLADGEQTLTLTVTEMDQSGANVSIDTTEEMVSLDVHIAGVAEGNTTPIIVDLGPVMPKYLNMGNYHLYHVEGGSTNPMTLVGSVAEVDAHNEFYYDPNTGNLTVALQSFSEVAVVADTVNAWEGNFDYSWYTNAVMTATDEEADYVIANADQLAAFGAIVGGMDGQTQDSFSGKTVNLIADINLGDKESENNSDLIFYPIGYYNNTGSYNKTSGGSVTSGVESFGGTFNGQGHTIANFYQNTWEMFGDYNSGYSGTPNHYKDAMGLFGYVLNGKVLNLTVDNFSSDGEFTPTGVIAAYADGDSEFSNIAITNCNPRVYNTGNGGIIGIVGDTGAANDDHIILKNITVDNSNKISALWGSYDVACGGLVGMYRGNVDGSGNATGDTISFTNCHVSAQMDVYNDVCGNYQYYAYRYAGMMIGSVRHNTKNTEGKTIPDMTGISATGCTVNYGDWNDYYYCEFEKNGHPSYSGPDDYKFSRVPHSELEFTDSNGNGLVDADERASVTGCKHNHTDAENNQAIYLPFHQLFTGYGWGVNSIGLEQYSGIVTNLDITEGDQEESEVKFETKFTGNFLYRVGNKNTVSLGSLFKAVEGASISNSGVVATIVKVDENMTVGGTFNANTTDWTKGTIQFSGTGIVKVTIQDYNFCKPTELYLEVVDAENTTTATNATSKNVVLLNDISSGFTVSGAYTFYGNGFTLNYTGNGQYLNNGLRQGVVTVSENGTLDNLRIKASIYPAAYMYYGSTVLGEYVQSGPTSVEGDKTRYHYQLSSVVLKGNATVSNCYIYGGRTNIFVDTGDVTIKDTVLENAPVANVQIQSAEDYTVVLEDVTTIQYLTKATIGDTSKNMLGTGVLVGPDTTSNPTIVLNGNFKQYNWVTADDATTVSGDVARKIINGALSATAYNHTVDGKTASNLGIIYMNTEEVKVENKTGLPYKEGEIDMDGVSGKVYSLQNATFGQIYSDYENADKATVNGDYMPTFVFDLGDQEISYDGSEDTRYLYGDASGVTALYQDGEAPLTLDLSKLATVYKYTGTNYSVEAVCKNSSGNALSASNNVVTLDAQDEYTLVFTVSDNIFYDKDGQTIGKSVTRVYTVPLTLTVKEADVKNAEISITKTALDGVYTTVNLTDYKLRINFLECISVTDYDNKETGTTVDLTSNISSATLTPASVNVFTTASTATITYTDGRELTVNFSKISGSSAGTKTATINTSGGVYFITDGALNNKPTEASSQNKCTITSVSYKGASGSTVTNDTDVAVTWALGSSSSGGGCVTPDTLITLADGTQKRIDQVTYADQLLVWDFVNGEYTTAPASIVMNHGFDTYEVVTLNFADGTAVNTINGHGFYAAQDNKFVILSNNNAAEYIGCDFVKQDGSVTKLVSYSVKQGQTESWSVLTAAHYNCILEGMLTVTPAEVDGSPDYLMPFAVGVDMKYDEAAMKADIEQYGLYTYEEFADYMTEEQFNALGLANFKVAVGKGYITYEEILYLISIHLG